MRKISEAGVMRFLKRYNQGEFPHLRLGQAFVNEFKLDCQGKHPHYCLFHEMHDEKAAKYILGNLVDSS